MKYEILENARVVKFEEIELPFCKFVDRCVHSNRRDRWLSLVRKPKQLSKKFGGLWGHLILEKSKALDIGNLPICEWNYYDGMDESIYIISTDQLEVVCLDSDGLVFSENGKFVVFFTHEGTQYVFEL